MSDPITTMKPGVPMNDTERAALAEANRAATEEAHRLAAQRRAQDELNAPPLINVLSESIKDKLKQLPQEEQTQS